MSERRRDGKHKVVGFGWNHLREGVPGIHGETGAIMNMGRIVRGYGHLTATSSLSPCPFCQSCLALHLGVREIRILDATNYKPDFSGYKRVGLTPTVSEHAGIVRTFGKWVRDPKNAVIWNRDIGVWDAKVPPVFDAKRSRVRAVELLNIASQEASDGLEAGEAPIGALVVDRFGEVIGAGHPRISADDDPSAVAAMVAWRACGARDHWKDKTLVLTCGPDHIAYSMFHIFKFGQLLVGSDRAFAGRLADVRGLGVRTHVIRGRTSDTILSEWLRTVPRARAKEFLGADFTGIG
jgi:tRNA(Arg) A34 adenosine deaminase TadA